MTEQNKRRPFKVLRGIVIMMMLAGVVLLLAAPWRHLAIGLICFARMPGPAQRRGQRPGCPGQ